MYVIYDKTIWYILNARERSRRRAAFRSVITVFETHGGVISSGDAVHFGAKRNP